MGKDLVCIVVLATLLAIPAKMLIEILKFSIAKAKYNRRGH
jgi:hypothetical protein